MSASPWFAALFALFTWWFSTGAILIAVRRADLANRGLRTTLLGLPLLLGGAALVHLTAGRGDVTAVYLAFLGAIALWGWIELAFLTGIVTGPNPHPCPEDCPPFERFIRAWGTIAYHEMALAGTLIVLGLHAHGQANRFAFWTFAVLFAARVSAKLNLFLGVPRINTEFLPRALTHLPSHFRKGPVSWLFPLAITGLSFAAACWLERLYSAGTPGAAVGFALLFAMTALALIEHWFLVLDLPDEKLWRWMLPAPKPQQDKTTRPEGSHGF